MDKLFLKIIKFIDSNFLSLIIGFILGIIINLLTSSTFNGEYIVIYILLICSIVLVFYSIAIYGVYHRICDTITYNIKVEEQHKKDSKKGDEIQKDENFDIKITKMEIQQEALDKNPWIPCAYILPILGTVLLIGISISLIIPANQQISTQNAQKEAGLKNSFNSLDSNITNLNRSLLLLDKKYFINYSSDSTQK